MIGKTGLYMPLYLGGSILVIIGSALAHTNEVDSSVGSAIGYSVILGVGVGCYSQISFTVAQAKAPREDIAVAVTFIVSAQVNSIAVSFAVAYSIFMNTATNQIASILPNASIADIQAAITGVNAPFIASLPQSLKSQILEAVNGSIQKVWIQVLAAGALSSVLALVMKRERITVKK